MLHPTNVSAELTRLYGRRLIHLQLVPASAFSAYRHAFVYPGALFTVRLAQAWETALQSMVSSHRHWLLIRPDVELLKPLPLLSTCAALPGLNIISGSLQRPALFHNRDWDWALLACEPQALGLWLSFWIADVGSHDANRSSCSAPLLAQGLACPPAMPREADGRPAFSGSWGLAECTLSNEPLCAPLRDFALAGVRLGTLDALPIYSNMFRLSAVCARNGTLLPMPDGQLLYPGAWGRIASSAASPM